MIQYQCSLQKSPRQSANAKAFAEVCLCYLVSSRLGKKKKRKKKKNTDAFKSTEIFKKCTSKNKIYFCLKKKSNVSLNKKVIFGFHTIFKLVFITQINYINYIDVCILFLFLFVLLYLILRNGTYIQLAKVQQQNEWK